MCGEKDLAGGAQTLLAGSPPRVRGKACKPFQFPHFQGITPACAGKRLHCGRWVLHCGDHPRVCGEKTGLHHQKQGNEGSPPRVRGKAQNAQGQPFDVRITPACAGKSLLNRHSTTPFGDHPRVCGEKRTSPDARTTLLGSPPRVRGKVKQLADRVLQAGITPACAGKRLKKALKNKDF